jgi:hypothetical protein
MRFRSITAALGAAAIAMLALAATSAAQAPHRANFVRTIDNPYFPQTPGTVYTYRGAKDGKSSRDVVRVTHRTKTIQGVRTVVVHDELFLSGKLAETTNDWYAQDRAGNVWYFGEDTKELDPNGNVTSTEGSWQWGRDGAVGGIVMLAHPHVGDSYRQEFFAGHAEDQARVLSLDWTVHVPYGGFRHVLKTRETTRLEPDVLSNKYYARGVGMLRELDVQGGDERSDLVSGTHGK